MNTLVLSLLALGGLGLFAAWLCWTLRTERVRAQALRAQARDRVLASRQATRAARRESTIPVETGEVVRAGAFCRVPGSHARDTNGAVMVCTNERRGRPRWRHADELRHAS